MPAVLKSASRDDILTRVQTQLVRDAVKATGKGSLLSKAEQEKLDRDDVLKDAAMEVRRTVGKGGMVSLEPLVDAAQRKVIGALDAVDKPKRGHGKISLAEAREAVATKGNEGFRIGHAFELITGASLEAKGAASPELQAAVAALVASKGFAVLSGLKDDKATSWVQNKIETTLEKWGGDSVNFQGKLKIGDEIVHVATAATYGKKSLTEFIGLFDNEGRVVGRAQIVRNDDTFALQMNATDLKGKPTGANLGVVPVAGAVAPDAAWVTALKADLQKKYDDGDDLGVDMKKSALPKELVAAYEFMERNTPDGVGLEKIDFQGQTAYAIHDYSCVSSVAVYSPDGTKLVDFVD